MKPLVPLLLMILALPATASTIVPADASKHVGEAVTVKGVASVYQAKSGVTFIDMGGSGRNAPFTGVIFKDRVSAFPNVVDYNGKAVEISGTIKLYNGKPEIILETAGQLSGG